MVDSHEFCWCALFLCACVGWGGGHASRLDSSSGMQLTKARLAQDLVVPLQHFLQGAQGDAPA